MTRLFVCAAVTTALILASCATQGAVRQLEAKADMVAPGMSKAELINVLGEPGKREFRDGEEALQYCSTGFFNDEYTTVFLRQDRVVGRVNDVAMVAVGSCAGRFPAVDWTSRKLEARND